MTRARQLAQNSSCSELVDEAAKLGPRAPADRGDDPEEDVGGGESDRLRTNGRTFPRHQDDLVEAVVEGEEEERDLRAEVERDGEERRVLVFAERELEGRLQEVDVRRGEARVEPAEPAAARDLVAQAPGPRERILERPDARDLVAQLGHQESLGVVHERMVPTRVPVRGPPDALSAKDDPPGSSPRPGEPASPPCAQSSVHA